MFHSVFSHKITHHHTLFSNLRQLHCLASYQSGAPSWPGIRGDDEAGNESELVDNSVLYSFPHILSYQVQACRLQLTALRCHTICAKVHALPPKLCQKDMLQLRSLSVTASFCGIAYNLLQPTPLWAPAAWGAFFISCHLHLGHPWTSFNNLAGWSCFFSTWAHICQNDIPIQPRYC